MSMNTGVVRTRSGAKAVTGGDAVVVVLSLVVAGIHLYLVPDEVDKGATGYTTLFILAAVGYIVALVLRYLPLKVLTPFRQLALVLIAGVALAAIIAYLSLGYFDTLGWVTKGIEAVLIVACVAAFASDRKGRAAR